MQPMEAITEIKISQGVQCRCGHKPVSDWIFERKKYMYSGIFVPK